MEMNLRKQAHEQLDHLIDQLQGKCSKDSGLFLCGGFEDVERDQKRLKKAMRDNLDIETEKITVSSSIFVRMMLLTENEEYLCRH
jgi:hypothetical protein